MVWHFPYYRPTFHSKKTSIDSAKVGELYGSVNKGYLKIKIKEVGFYIMYLNIFMFIKNIKITNYKKENHISFNLIHKLCTYKS